MWHNESFIENIQVKSELTWGSFYFEVPVLVFICLSVYLNRDCELMVTRKASSPRSGMDLGLRACLSNTDKRSFATHPAPENKSCNK